MTNHFYKDLLQRRGIISREFFRIGVTFFLIIKEMFVNRQRYHLKNELVAQR